MALLTGGCDDWGCLLSNLGIDSSEFSAPLAGGRLDVYQGLASSAGGNGASLSMGTAGNCTMSSCPLWSSKAALEHYDLVVLSCECAEDNQTKPASAMQAMHDWLDEGGRVFATHYQYTWFKNAPTTDFQNAATWLGTSVAAGTGTYDLDTTFAKGLALEKWLALSSTIQLSGVASSVSSVSAAAARWIYDPSTSPNNTKAFSFLTPIGGACGRVAFTDAHESSSLLASVSSIPSGCTAGSLTPQQKALEFLFFELSGCVSADNAPPPPPPASQ
jgi:hypothetical protein